MYVIFLKPWSSLYICWIALLLRHLLYRVCVCEPYFSSFIFIRPAVLAAKYLSIMRQKKWELNVIKQKKPKKYEITVKLNVTPRIQTQPPLPHSFFLSLNAILRQDVKSNKNNNTTTNKQLL